MWRRLWQWINVRWPADAVVKALLTEDIPGGATVKYGFGASVLFVFILQAATGVWQLFFYVPTADHAYNSVSFLRTQVPFGWLIHNLHYWGATVMVVLVLLHIMRVYIWGAYKSPRELTWVLGTFLFLLTMSMMFFGPPLPWDQKGYWATEVGTSIAGTMPLIGNWLKMVLIGGDAMGQLTVSRLFTLHVAVLPGLLAVFIALHLVSFRRFGSVGPWREADRVRRGVFWPDQVHKDLIMALAVFLVLLALCVFAQPPFTGPADPLDTTYTPKPEWNFLFLYQALKLFPGKLEIVGTVGVPLVGILILLSVPFVDRRSERNPARRPVAMAALFAAAVVVVALSLIGNASHPGVSPAGQSASGPQRPALGAGASSSTDGARLFRSLGCEACHMLEGKGGKIGPDLTDERSRGRTREWLTEQLRNAKSHNPTSVMPSFSSVKESDLEGLVSFLTGLKAAGGTQAEADAHHHDMPPEPATGQPAGASVISPAQQYIGSAESGKLLFSLNCQSCHGPEGKDKVPNPGSDDGTVPPLNPIDRELFDSDPASFVSKIDPYPQNGSTPSGPHPALKMPDFGRSMALTQEQIANLEAYILRLNGVERARVSHPGLQPVSFFILAIAVFATASLVFAGIALSRRRPRRRPYL